MKKPKKLINPQKYLDRLDDEEDGIMTMEEIDRAVENSAHLMAKAVAQHSAKNKKEDS